MRGLSTKSTAARSTPGYLLNLASAPCCPQKHSSIDSIRAASGWSQKSGLLGQLRN